MLRRIRDIFVLTVVTYCILYISSFIFIKYLNLEVATLILFIAFLMSVNQVINANFIAMEKALIQTILQHLLPVLILIAALFYLYWFSFAIDTFTIMKMFIFSYLVCTIVSGVILKVIYNIKSVWCGANLSIVDEYISRINITVTNMTEEILLVSLYFVINNKIPSEISDEYAFGVRAASLLVISVYTFQGALPKLIKLNYDTTFFSFYSEICKSATIITLILLCWEISRFRYMLKFL